MFRWLILLISGLLEVVWAQNLKLSNGFTKLIPTITMVIFGALSTYCLAIATRSIPLGIAYAIWSGIGEIGILALGYFLYGEVVTPPQMFFIALIITSIIGIKVSS